MLLKSAVKDKTVGAMMICAHDQNLKREFKTDLKHVKIEF